MATASWLMSSSLAIVTCQCTPEQRSSSWRARPAGDTMTATARTSSIGGVHGRLLRVDLGDDAGTGWSEPLAPEVFAEVIGGIGLASLLLLRLCPPGANPLG